MIEDSIYESIESLKTLDISHVPARVIEPKSSEPIIFELSNFATKSMLPPAPASVTTFQGSLSYIQRERPSQN